MLRRPVDHSIERRRGLIGEVIGDGLSRQVFERFVIRHDGHGKALAEMLEKAGAAAWDYGAVIWRLMIRIDISQHLQIQEANSAHWRWRGLWAAAPA